MVFDVMIRENFTNNGKQIVNVFRVHDAVLSKYLRIAQDSGKYIISVIPLFRKREHILNMSLVDDEDVEVVDSIGE